jgi:predicted dienelactone hydrolase
VYTALLEDIASQGFVVIGLDHPGETVAVEFPRGRVAYRRTPENPAAMSPALAQEVLRARVADVEFAVDSIRRIAVMAHLGLSVDATRVGLFGHSLGGLAAAHIAAADRRVDCAADLAGSVLALPPGSQFKRPFMILSSQKVDGTLVRFWRRLHGERWWVKLAGALHLDFSDWAWLAPHLKRFGITPLSAHQVERGRASTTIERRYLDSFFAHCLLTHV